jgi:hypothetical protein
VEKEFFHAVGVTRQRRAIGAEPLWKSAKQIWVLAKQSLAESPWLYFLQEAKNRARTYLYSYTENLKRSNNSCITKFPVC